MTNIVEQLRLLRIGPHDLELRAAIQKARDEIERLQAAIAWTREVRPGKNPESGGAIVHMTWDQFNTMRALAEPKP